MRMSRTLEEEVFCSLQKAVLGFRTRDWIQLAVAGQTVVCIVCVQDRPEKRGKVHFLPDLGCCLVPLPAQVDHIRVYATGDAHFDANIDPRECVEAAASKDKRKRDCQQMSLSQAKSPRTGGQQGTTGRSGLLPTTAPRVPDPLTLRATSPRGDSPVCTALDLTCAFVAKPSRVLLELVR